MVKMSWPTRNSFVVEEVNLDQFMLSFYDNGHCVKSMSVNTFLEHTTKRIMDLEAKVDSISKALGIDEKPKSLTVSTDIDCQFGTKGDVE